MKQRKKLKYFCLIAGCALIMPAITVLGQEPDTTKVVELEEVIITATRSKKKSNEVGRSVTVITSNEIKELGTSNILELLNRKEGLYIVGAQQNPGNLSSVFTRGANGNHTVVMIDGVRITDPTSTDNSINLAELSLANVERIEIVRGSHSTLYGSSAIGGVINIITQKNKYSPGIHVDADIKGGVFNESGSLLSENVSLNFSHETGLYSNVGIFNTISKGFNSTVDTITNPNTYKHSNMGDNFIKTDLIGKIGYRNSKVDMYVGYKKIVQDLDIDDGAFRDDDNYSLKFDRNLITYGATYNFNHKFTLKFNGGQSDMVRKTTDDSSRVDALGTTDKSFFRGKYSGTLSNNELQLNYNTKGLQLVVGSGLSEESMTAETYYFSNQFGIYESESNLDSLHINSTISNVFIHTDLNGILLNTSLKPYSLGLGARFVKHSTFGSTITYEINPSVKINKNTLLYLSYSTGFNAPSLYQLYSPEQDFNSGITRGNKNLKPEESQTWEIGIKQNISKNIGWSTCYFNTIVENIVDYIYLWNKNQEIDSLSYFDYFGDTYINLGKQTNRGVEFSIHSKISDKLFISGNFSIVNGKLEHKPENIDTTHTQGNHIQLYSNGAFIYKEVESIGLVRRPNTANINLTFLPNNKLTLHVNAKYVGARNDVFYDSSLGPFGALGNVGIEDFTLLDLTAKYEIIKNLSAMIHIENIFDTQYYEIRGYATRGRGLYLSLKYNY